jgi:2-polyprenyl-3-methyl-5-hydroxy-6-metoxy-1,4-benzoquinol methylase
MSDPSSVPSEAMDPSLVPSEAMDPSLVPSEAREETVHALDAEALDLFARKGYEGGPNVPQAGPANGVKVRRIMQITRDLGRRPFPELRILDLGCGEGVYAIEAGLRGAEVLALDARTQRMEQGAACAARHGLSNVRFIQQDVRLATREALGSFDVVYLLGLLYHLDAPDLFRVLENIHGLCTGLLVIDTLISLTAEIQVEWRGQLYGGRRCREHDDEDTAEVRRSRVLRSIDNTFSLRPTKESLLRALRSAGFTSAYECHLPFEPGKAEERITLVALQGAPVLLSTYPWVNHQSESSSAERSDAEVDTPSVPRKPREIARLVSFV